MTQDLPDLKPPAPSRPRTLLYAVGGVVVALILIAVGIYVWRALTVRSLEQRIETQKTEMGEAKRQALKLQAQEMLRLAGRPLAWAVRAELLKNNLGQVDDYLRQFVREPGVKALMLVGKDGKVMLASDRKLETQNAAPLLSKAIAEASDVIIEESAEGLRMGVPVMGFDDRMGILVIDYAPPVGGDAPAPVGAPVR